VVAGVQPTFSLVSIPSLPSLGLSDEERGLVTELAATFKPHLAQMQRDEAYYLGEQHIRNLRIAVPKELEFLRTIVGWASLAVDPYVERLAVDGFRLPGATDADADLSELASAVGLEALVPLATTDALSLGRGYWMVGTDPDSDVPLVTVESPLNTAVLWDLSGRNIRAAWAPYREDNRWFASLMLPGQTVLVTVDDSGVLQVVDRDVHGMGVPMVRMPHQPRTNAREGRSAITPAVRSTVDSACRDLLGLEISREFYSIPRVTLLGASEADFQDSSGKAKTAWEVLITKYNAIERDDDGNVPQLHQLTAYDPSVFTRVIDMRASQMASLVAAPPQDLGLYTSGNPVSADAVGAMETRRNRRARRMQAEFGRSIADVMKLVLAFQNNGTLPAEFARLETDWADVDEISLVAASDAITKQVATGIVPPTSDVVLKRLGYTAVERQRLAQDREAQADQTAAQQIIDALGQPQTPEVPGNGNESSPAA